MVRLADASFRRRCGSVRIQGAKRAYRRCKAQEKAGVISLVSSVLLSNQFYAKRTLAERSQPGRGQTRQKGITKCRTTLCLRFSKVFGCLSVKMSKFTPKFSNLSAKASGYFC